MSEIAAAFGQGFALQAGLIVALGAQNLYVLDSGLKRRKHWQVAAVCAICDAGLIALGVFGAGLLFVTYPWLQIAMGGVGAGFLFWYAASKWREGLAPQANGPLSGTQAGAARPLAAALAFSLLNPHVYLDTIVLIGGYSTRFPASDARMGFGAGAAAFSAVWFFGLAGLAARMSGILSGDVGRRAVALGSAAILTILAAILGAEVWRWVRALP